MLGPSPAALLTQSPPVFTVSEDPMGSPGPGVQETDIRVRTQHMGLGDGQIWNTVDVLTNFLGKVQTST